MLLQSTVYSLTNSTQILSLFCRWCLTIGEMETNQTSHRTGNLDNTVQKQTLNTDIEAMYDNTRILLINIQ